MSAAFFAISSVEEADDFLQTLVKRANPAMEDAGSRGEASVDSAVAAILADVRSRGLEAVVEYNRRFDAPEFTENLFRVPHEELALAAISIPSEDARIIAEAADNIRVYHQAQKGRAWFLPRQDGSMCGQMVTPVHRAGIYGPAGQGASTPRISSLLMGVIPAQVAGVQEIVVVSPPNREGRVNTHILAAANHLADNNRSLLEGPEGQRVPQRVKELLPDFAPALESQAESLKNIVLDAKAGALAALAA